MNGEMVRENHTAGSVRCYLAYAGSAQKLVQFLLVPLASLAASALMTLLAYLMARDQVMIEDTPLDTVFSFYLMYIVAICDVIFDRNNFGGTFSSRASHVEYMKSSPRGTRLYENILRGSMIVRFLYAAGCVLLFRFVRVMFASQAIVTALCAWVFFTGATWLAAQAGALLTRFFEAENISLAVALISALLVSVLFGTMSAIGFAQDVSYAIAGVLEMLIGAGIAVLMVRTGVRKKEGEYHDV